MGLSDGQREAIRVLIAEGATEAEVTAQLGVTRRALRDFLGRSSDKPAVGLGWQSEGVTAGELPDEDEVFRRACAAWQGTQRLIDRKASQLVRFDDTPAICLVFAGDQHLGNAGTDYPRAFREAELVRDTPGMVAWLMGDLLDNFVIGKLRQARDASTISIPDEWALVRRYLRIIGPKLVGVTSGNHDQWSTMLAGVDYFREVLAGVAPGALYDSDDSRVAVRVGGENGHTFRLRMRHKWRGTSIYSPTHGQERAARWDDDADIFVGAHTHAAGVSREFTVGGASKLAVQVGAYKRYDAYARREGFAMPNTSTAVAVVLTWDGAMTGFANLELAADFIGSLIT